MDGQLADDLRRLLDKAKENPKDLELALELLGRIRDPNPAPPVAPRPPVPAVVPVPGHGIGVSGLPPQPAPRAPGGVDPRLQQLERRLDEVMRELRQLRQELRPGERGATDPPLQDPRGRSEADPEGQKANIYKLSNVIRRATPDGGAEYEVVPPRRYAR
jgi:hypothetical protein